MTLLLLIIGKAHCANIMNEVAGSDFDKTSLSLLLKGQANKLSSS